MSAVSEQELAGSGSHRRPYGGPETHPWQEDPGDVALDPVEEAVPLALALVPAKGVE